MKTAVFVGALAAIADLTIASNSLDHYLPNDIPGSVDGLFYIANVHHGKNLQQDTGYTILAPGTETENQLWYFELSGDKKHVAIKNYKNKRDAFNANELFEVVPVDYYAKTFRLKSKSDNNFLFSHGYSIGRWSDGYPDAVWRAKFHRFSLKDKPLKGEFYIRNAQPSNMPNWNNYAKHSSTMAKLTCEGEDKEPAATDIFEPGSAFSTTQLFTFEYHPKGKYVRIVSSVQNKYWTNKLVFQGFSDATKWYKGHHANFASPDSTNLYQWFELVETGTEKYRIKTMVPWNTVHLANSVAGIAETEDQTFLQGVKTNNKGTGGWNSYIRATNYYTPPFKNHAHQPAGCLKPGMEGSCDWYIRPRYRAIIKRRVQANNQYRNCQRTQKYEVQRELTIGWTQFYGIAQSHTTSQSSSFQSSLEQSVHAEASAGGSFMGIGMEASGGVSETETRTITKNMATEMTNSAQSSTTHSVVHKETTWFRASPMTYLEYYQFHATIRSTDSIEFTGVRQYFGVKGSYEVPITQAECDQGTGAGTPVWHLTRGTYKG